MMRIPRRVPLNHLRERGFTLLEIIIVLALIGVIATVILPNLNITVDSQMSVSIKNLTSQIRSTYDNAIFTGRLQRIVFNITTGEFWTEEAPLNFKGRPPSIESQDNVNFLSNKKSYLSQLNEREKSLTNRPSAFSSADNPVFYSIRSIPIIQKKVLTPIDWVEVKDSIITKKKLLGNVIFAKFSSSLIKQPFDYVTIANSSDKQSKVFGYIYFLPDGTGTPTSIHLAIKTKLNSIAENDVKYTLNLNTLTGQTTLLEGFQDANFKNVEK